MNENNTTSNASPAMQGHKLHPALRDLLRPMEPESSGIRMDSIGNWSCAKLGLRGYGTLRQLKNAIARKQAKN